MARVELEMEKKWWKSRNEAYKNGLLKNILTFREKLTFVQIHKKITQHFRAHLRESESLHTEPSLRVGCFDRVRFKII